MRKLVACDPFFLSYSPPPSFSISPFLSVALDLIFSSTSVLGRQGGDRGSGIKAHAALSHTHSGVLKHDRTRLAVPRRAIERKVRNWVFGQLLRIAS